MGRHVIERFAAEIVKQDIEEGLQLSREDPVMSSPNTI